VYKNNKVNDIGYQGRNKGALVIKMPYNYAGVTNTIKVDAITVIENGVTKAPFEILSSAASSWNGFDPAKHYLLIR